jgi:hypothetical protein
LAAKTLVDQGIRTQLLDIGFDDPGLRDAIPDAPFSELRRRDRNQGQYFIGDCLQGIPPQGVKVGAQLTAPRQFIHREADRWLPALPGDFVPLQSTSLGGLGAGWGAACFTFSEEELSKAGLPPNEFPDLYRRAASIMGVSADPESEVNRWLWHPAPLSQRPLDVDDNAQRILERSRRRSGELARIGIHAGRIPMAILTSDLPPRRANPYYDMDFYGDSRMSVFRPRYLVTEMLRGDNFSYTPHHVVLRVAKLFGGGIAVSAIDTRDGKPATFLARRVILCAGALNTARIGLNSLGIFRRPTGLLCNPYTYFPTVNLEMLGRPAADRRHSMAQLGGVLLSSGGDWVDGVFQMYSYRSLLLFKLVKEMPLPPRAGLLVARALVNALAIFGLFFQDRQSIAKRLSILPAAPDRTPALHFDYSLSRSEQEWRGEAERRFRRALWKMGCMPIGRINPGNAGSIHYAGTAPFSNPLLPGFQTNPDGCVEGLPGVYTGDSASWAYLPAKGLSFTLAANGIRVARLLARAL